MGTSRIRDIIGISQTIFVDIGSDKWFHQGRYQDHDTEGNVNFRNDSSYRPFETGIRGFDLQVDIMKVESRGGDETRGRSSLLATGNHQRKVGVRT